MKTLCLAVAIAGGAVAIGGCATYYEVREPVGGNAYYTTGIDKTKSGAVKFKDDKSGGMITLQDSEVREISEDQYRQGLYSAAGPGRPK